jgi:hypothetical protein
MARQQCSDPNICPSRRPRVVALLHAPIGIGLPARIAGASGRVTPSTGWSSRMSALIGSLQLHSRRAASGSWPRRSSLRSGGRARAGQKAATLDVLLEESTPAAPTRPPHRRRRGARSRGESDRGRVHGRARSSRLSRHARRAVARSRFPPELERDRGGRPASPRSRRQSESEGWLQAL